MFTTVEEALGSVFNIPAHGEEITILCPFHKDIVGHEDHTPSLRVNRVSGLFQCKSCHKAGNFRQLYAKTSGITELQAAFRLKSVFYPSGKIEKKSRNEQELESVLSAYEYFSSLSCENWLENTQDAYLPSRGFLPETLNAYEARIDPERIYRYVFPLREQSVVVGALRRRCDDPSLELLPKYLHNTGFKKELHLIGHLVPGVVLLVEGLLDSMMSHQFGVKNNAAILGNDISDVQLYLLLQYASEIVWGGDNDEAGEEGYRILVNKVNGRRPVRRLKIGNVNDIPEMRKADFLQSFYYPKHSFTSLRKAS